MQLLYLFFGIPQIWATTCCIPSSHCVEAFTSNPSSVGMTTQFYNRIQMYKM